MFGKLIRRKRLCQTTLAFSFALLFCVLFFGNILKRAINRSAIEKTNKKAKPEEIFVLSVVFQTSDLHNYRVALESFECYCKHYGYTFMLVNAAENKTLQMLCPQNDKMFRRHCIAAYLLDELSFRWMVFIDSDIGVVNPNRTLEEFIDPDADITFYDRLYNWEVMAGSYIAKKTRYALQFLRIWANYNWLVPKSFHGTDNGAIHNVLLDFLHPNMTKQRMLCEEIWSCSKKYDHLFLYEACARELLNASIATQKHIKIFPKAKGWARDAWITESLFSSRDLAFHGWKTQTLNGKNEMSHWRYPFKKERFDMKLCKTEHWYSNFEYKEEFLSQQTVDTYLSKKIKAVQDEYMRSVRRLSSFVNCSSL